VVPSFHKKVLGRILKGKITFFFFETEMVLNDERVTLGLKAQVLGDFVFISKVVETYWPFLFAMKYTH